MSTPTTIGDLAVIVTSKNAGPYRLTIDVFCEDPRRYERIKRSGVVTAERVAALYGIKPEQVRTIRFSDAALGLKVTMEHHFSSDDFRTSDVYGAQQHMPLARLVVPGDDAT